MRQCSPSMVVGWFSHIYEHRRKDGRKRARERTHENTEHTNGQTNHQQVQVWAPAMATLSIHKLHAHLRLGLHRLLLRLFALSGLRSAVWALNQALAECFISTVFCSFESAALSVPAAWLCATKPRRGNRFSLIFVVVGLVSGSAGWTSVATDVTIDDFCSISLLMVSPFMEIHLVRQLGDGGFVVAPEVEEDLWVEKLLH